MRININVQNECKFDTGKMKSRVSEALKYGAEAVERTARDSAGIIKVKIAPYRVANGEIITIPNPIASVKFFTNNKLPVDNEELFFLKHNGKLYKKVALTDYGKCTLIIGERYEN